MKKLFAKLCIVQCAVCMTLTMSAQERKTWDFTSGLSAETVANLTADETNWAPNGTDKEGVTNNWKNHSKHAADEPWQANGVVIKELEGLLIDIGSNGDNSLHLAQEKLRLTRKGTKITFPQLENGQKITIVGRSANSSAENRGIAPTNSSLVLVDGTTTNDACLFLGNQVEGSLGTYSFTWEVQSSDGGPVDVQFQLTPEAGIDFTLFQIDEGDVPDVVKVAYLYDGNEDVVYNYLNAREYTELTAINVTAESITAEQLKGFDVTIVGAAVPIDNAAVAVVKEALPWTPTLNLNGQLYPVWAYGTAVQTSSFAKINSQKNSLFNEVGYEATEDGNVIIMSNSGFETSMLSVSLGDYFANDVVAAVSMEDQQAVAVHTHNINHNGYVYMPYVPDYTDAAMKLFDNAVVVLQKSKKEITAALAPTISMEYKDMHTLVSIKAPNLPKSVIYYTTDGSEPTTSSNVYTDVIDLYNVCTVKAAAIAEGYTLSPVASANVAIMQQPKTPVVDYTLEEGQTIITISCESPEAVIWYNFNNSTDTTISSRYVEPVVIKMPATITAFSVAGEAVWSETTEQRVLVRNPRVVIDVASHFRASKWEDVGNGAGLFSWGKSAASMYEPAEEGAEDEILYDPETGEPIGVIPAHGAEKEYESRDEATDDPQWVVMSKGQSVLWQNLTVKTDVIGSDEGGYYPATAECISELFPITSYDVQFYKIMENEPANAVIQSKNKFQAPLDVVTIANMQGGPLVVQVSADGNEWTTVGDEIEPTGMKRMWKLYTNSYEGTDEVYVRLAQLTGSMGAKIFDVYVANAGPESQALLAEIQEEFNNSDAGVHDINGQNGWEGTCNAGAVYSISGLRRVAADRGLNIIVGKNGQTRKVLVK